MIMELKGKRASPQDITGKPLSFTYVPRGVQAEAFKALRAKEENARLLSDHVLLRKLENQTSKVELWMDVVVAEFDRLWCNTEAELIKRGDAMKAAKAAKTARVRVKADHKGKGRAGQADEDDEESDDSDRSQRSVTEVIEELSVLTRKAINVIASGSLYHNDMYEHGIPSHLTSFNLRTILPRGCVLRDPTVNPIIQVAPLPDLLQQHIESNAVGKRQCKDDISSLTSQAQLSSMHCQFLGLKRDERKHTGKHPFATNEENLWHGSIYDKELDYFLCIYLRLHLAPRRESAFKNRVVEAARRKRDKNEATRAQRRLDGWTSRILWRSIVLELCNDLELPPRNSRKELENPLGRRQHVESILKKLVVLHDSEPAPSDEISSRIAPLEILIEGQRLADETDAKNVDAQLEIKEDELGEVQSAAELEELTFDDLEEIDLDDLDWDRDWDWDDDEQDEVARTDVDEKEPSRATLRSLQAVAKILLESNSVSHRISPNYVKGMAYVGKKFTDRQCAVVAHVANTLRPYIPKSWVKGEQDDSDTPSSKTKPHTPHITLRAPAGYPQFNRRVSPQVSPAALHGLLLSASGLYEVLCPKEANDFDILDSDVAPKYILSSNAILYPGLAPGTYGSGIVKSQIFSTAGLSTYRGRSMEEHAYSGEFTGSGYW
ncbi:hypothetical protein BGZ75_004727 [Mortierella antarctica]|nr:hypothetical protein BGZ75_004727 [Mortierella antarctica]